MMVQWKDLSLLRVQEQLVPGTAPSRDSTWHMHRRRRNYSFAVYTYEARQARFIQMTRLLMSRARLCRNAARDSKAVAAGHTDTESSGTRSVAFA